MGKDFQRGREERMKRVHVSGAVGSAVLLLGLAIAGGNALAQSDAAPPPLPPGENVFYMRTGPGPFGAADAIGFVAFEGDLGGKTVTNAPFSATISTETTQVLADGNRIERSTSGTLARDSQGRTRRDMTLPAIGPWGASGQAAPHAVFINDSVAGTRYILDPDQKVAHMARPKHGGRGGNGAGSDAQVSGSARGARAPERDVTTTSLGTQTINGVQAEGTRTTRTIPAGAIGNANAIVITTDRWYSAELQTVVMSKRTDPMTGNTTFQLTNIQRQEPDASLFQVPADYTVKQDAPGVRGRYRINAGQAPPPPPQN